MSKKKVEEAVGEFLNWLPNYDIAQRDELVHIVGRMLASLPGGDEFEDYGFEPYSAVNWVEFKMIHDIYMAVEDKWDVEQAAEMFFHDDEDEDEDDED
jgi:hypothetical protein